MANFCEGSNVGITVAYDTVLWCFAQAEASTGQPHGYSIEVDEFVIGAPVRVATVSYQVYPLLNCHVETKYSDLLGYAANEKDASQCALGLSRITKKEHEAVQIWRFMIADAWTVQLKNRPVANPPQTSNKVETPPWSPLAWKFL